MKRIAICLLAVLTTMSGWLVGAEKSVQNSPELKAVETAIMVNELRRQGVDNSEGAVKMFFSQRAQLRWQRIAEEYDEEQLNDFFMGSTYLGADDVAYAALYNPWWDAILVMNLSGLPEVPKVDSFALVSGCRFRGDANASPENLEGTVPLAKPYAMDLLSLVERTKKHYQEKFAANARGDLIKLMMNDAADTERIQVRSAVRLKFLLKFIQNKTLQHEARRISRNLTGGNEEKLLSYFTDGGADFLKTFAKIPGELRENFVPYCCFHGPEGTLFVFFNKDIPRIFVTVTYPKKSFKRIMEWYDLQAADEFMKAWASVKEGK
ncbi:MAG: hypothetical protein MJ202_07550 [Lentisphaeria bacterium]|nr:hypothetical protein [Lentisphaeria bacterium]